MSTEIDEVTRLAAEYMRLVGPEHHKDKDCHWYVETRWSYGEGPIFRAQHMGYCNEPFGPYGNGPDRTTYAAALNDLTVALRESIADVKTWDPA